MKNSIIKIKNPENTCKSRIDRDEGEFSKPEDSPEENIPPKMKQNNGNIEDR